MVRKMSQLRPFFRPYQTSFLLTCIERNAAHPLPYTSFSVLIGGPHLPLFAPPAVKGPKDSNLPKEPLDVAAVTCTAAPPLFSVSFRLDDHRLVNWRSLSLSDRRRINKALFAPLPLDLLEVVVVVLGVWAMSIGMPVGCGSCC